MRFNTLKTIPCSILPLSLLLSPIKTTTPQHIQTNHRPTTHVSLHSNLHHISHHIMSSEKEIPEISSILSRHPSEWAQAVHELAASRKYDSSQLLAAFHLASGAAVRKELYIASVFRKHPDLDPYSVAYAIFRVERMATLALKYVRPVLSLPFPSSEIA